MEQDVVSFFLKNPVVLGALITALLHFLHGTLEQLDKSGRLAPYSQYIHQAFLVVAFLATVLDAASKNQLGSLDLNSTSQFIQYWILVLVGGKAMAVPTVKK